MLTTTVAFFRTPSTQYNSNTLIIVLCTLAKLANPRDIAYHRPVEL